MKRDPFDNLPSLSKEEAIQILSIPIDELQLSSDYYKAVFHLYKYPSFDTEKALLNLLESNSNEHSIMIAKRKAIEILGRHGCVSAIPKIATFLRSSDPYLIENAAWALKALECKDPELIALIDTLLDDPKQNRRVLIQVLGEIGSVSNLSRIKSFVNDTGISPGVRGASIAAIMRLSGQSYQKDLLANFLSLPNQNDRQCAINDIIDLGDFNMLSLALKTPVASSFRMRAINELWPENIENLNGLDVCSAIDSLIQDDPNSLEISDHSRLILHNNDLVNNLFSTDFKTCYSALKNLDKKSPDTIWPIIANKIDCIRKDYGALYFFMILFRSVSGWSSLSLSEIKEITLGCLGANWPDYIKFKPVAILTLMKLFPESAIEFIPRWLDEEITPFWACRYAALLGIDQFLLEKDPVFFKGFLLDHKKDSNRFVEIRASRMKTKIAI